MTNDVMTDRRPLGRLAEQLSQPRGGALGVVTAFPKRMQDHQALVIIDGGGQIISVLEGVPTGSVQRVGSQRA